MRAELELFGRISDCSIGVLDQFGGNFAIFHLTITQLFPLHWYRDFRAAHLLCKQP